MVVRFGLDNQEQSASDFPQLSSDGDWCAFAKNVLYPSTDLGILNIVSEFKTLSTLTCTVICGTLHRHVGFVITHRKSADQATDGL